MNISIKKILRHRICNYYLIYLLISGLEISILGQSLDKGQLGNHNGNISLQVELLKEIYSYLLKKKTKRHQICLKLI